MKLTIGELLSETFPRLFETALNDNGELEIRKKRDFELLIHGVEVDMNTPIYWMQMNMAYLDNFIYLSMHFR